MQDRESALEKIQQENDKNLLVSGDTVDWRKTGQHYASKMLCRS